MRREKHEAKLERERIKAELARDKELRRLNNGVLPSVLGVDGYNPSAVTGANKPDAKRGREDSPSTAAPPAVSSAGTVESNPVKKPVTNVSAAPSQPTQSLEEREEIIDNAIATIGRYKTGGDGGQAFNLILLFLKNIRDNPEEPKYISLLTL